ncbi:aconitate hydratase, partial [bacterium]|nr:aconitate hydratase [bacterium]
MSLPSKDSFGIKSVLKTAAGDVDYFRLAGLEEQGLGAISKLPNSVKVVLESVARGENGREIVQDDVAAFAKYDPTSPQKNNVPYMPARVLMQDFTGVPAVVDLAALRSAMARQGKNPEKINPLLPVDLVIDHSVQVDQFGTRMALAYNTKREFERNAERYAFLRWGQKAFKNFRVIPPE